MDWIVVGAVVLGAYTVLNLLSSERITRAHQINAGLAAAALEKAKPTVEMPVGIATEVAFTPPGASAKAKR